MKKTPLIIASLIVGALTLTGCTNNDTSKDTAKTISFDSKELKVIPQWNVTKLEMGAWGSGNKEHKSVDEQKPENINPDEPYEAAPSDPNIQPGESNEEDYEIEVVTPPDDVFLYNNVSFFDTSTSCRITGTISYTDSYKASRGDLYNSKEYLYGLVPASQKPVTDEKIEVINNVEYVVGNYDQPAEWGGNSFHKTAIRVFSTPLTIADATGTSVNELGNYRSDTSKGLTVVSIDYNCAKAEDITAAQWKDGLKHFKLVFNPKVPVEVDPTGGITPEESKKLTENFGKE